MRTRKWGFFGFLLLSAVFLYGCGVNGERDNEEARNDESKTYAAKTDAARNETLIQGAGNKAVIDGGGAVQQDGVVTITGPGVYRLAGNLEAGQIIVDPGQENQTELILDNFTLANPAGAAIYGKSGQLTITLAAGTKNQLSDGSGYRFAEGEDEPNAVIFGKEDLIFQGSGSLSIQGNFEEGIRGKDGLTFLSGTYVIAAQNDAVKGKDFVEIAGGSFDLTTVSGDGIQSTHAEDEERGYVRIQGGDFTIKSGKKGILAETGIIIENGTIQIEAEDDAIHSDRDIHLMNGEYLLSTGDDAIHANRHIQIDDGLYNIPESYEGIEALSMDIHGGTFVIVSADDGLNAAGGSDVAGSDVAGNDFSGDNRPRGGRSFGATEGAYINITGGSFVINASGDGIDSNGALTIAGGSIFVEGSESGGDSPIDYDGTAVITGGEVIATGAAGMFQGFSEDSAQPFITGYLESAQAGGTSVRLLDAAGTVILEYTPEKSFAAVLISSPQLTKGESYRIEIGELSQEINIEAIANQFGQGDRRDGVGRGQGGRMRGNPPDAADLPDFPADLPGVPADLPGAPEDLPRFSEDGERDRK